MHLGDVTEHDRSEADDGVPTHRAATSRRARSSPIVATMRSACSARSRWRPPRCCRTAAAAVAARRGGGRRHDHVRAPDWFVHRRRRHRHLVSRPRRPARRHRPHRPQADGRHRLPRTTDRWTTVTTAPPRDDPRSPSRPARARRWTPRRTPPTRTATSSARPTASRSPRTGRTPRPTPASTTSRRCRNGSGCPARCSSRRPATAPTTRRWSTPSGAAPAATPAWR